MITLVLGGARSGKSRFAEAAADQWLSDNPGCDRVYVATAQIFDEEMRERVAKHKHQRGDNWRTIEEPMALADTLSHEAHPNRFILVDCLTLWLSNQLLAESDTDDAVATLCKTLASLEGNIMIVSNEVGLGIVPDNPLARRFRDIAGFANQEVAKVADKVVFIAAGLPLILKNEH